MTLTQEEKDAILNISAKLNSHCPRCLSLERALNNAIESIRGLRDFADDKCLLDFDANAIQAIQEIQEVRGKL